LVTATPSLVIRGVPNALSSTCCGRSEPRSSAAAKRESRCRPAEGTEHHHRRSRCEPNRPPQGRRKAGVVGRT
jgi:hypothetical protein